MNEYDKLLECIESKEYKKDLVTELDLYDSSIDKNFIRYGRNREDVYAVIYLSLVSNGVDNLLYLSSDKIGAINVPFTHVYGYRADMLSKEREKLETMAEGYNIKLNEEFSKSDVYDIEVTGLSIKAIKN